MTRRRKDPFAGKENVRHFRLVQRPLGNDEAASGDGSKMLNFDEMFEEYTKRTQGEHDEHDETFADGPENVEDFEDEDNYDFVNDEDGELVDIDAELDRFAEEFIDIEGEDGVDRIKRNAEAVAGEAAKYGILLDDRDYDYTRHLRKVGVTPGAVFIQAPGQKSGKSVNNTEKTRDFFEVEDPADQSTLGTSASNDLSHSEPDPSLIKANHEAARQQYRALLQQVGDDPVLREVIEALEDDRYVTEEIDDELVISLDNMNINANKNADEEELEDFFNDPEEEEVDILNENEEFPDFIPSEALKRQIAKLEQAERNYEQEQEQEQDEFDDILNEYNQSEAEQGYYNLKPDHSNSTFVDIEGDVNILDEEAEEIYKYLKEHGRSRGTTLYDKKRRPDHLPPIHIAIAQYNELRRELAVNNDAIIQKYAEEDEEEALKQVRESERIIEGMVKIIDDPEEMDKRVNIETAKYLLKLNSSIQTAAPKKIIESSNRKPIDPPADDESESSESELEVMPRVNKGVARSSNETAEEKKARKAKIKAEKREKRAIKSENSKVKK